MDVATLYKVRFKQDGIELKAKNAIWQVLCYHFFDRYIPPQSVILDVGAGYCEFINNIAKKKNPQEKIAVDLNEMTRHFAAPDVRVLHEDCLCVASLQAGSVDIIFMSNFLEHLRDKAMLLTLLAECRRLLRPQGKLLILQPNIRLVGGAYWDFFDHHLPLTEKSLTEALQISGFAVTECITRFLPYTTKSVLPQHPLLVQLYLWCRPAWIVLGKQSFLVASPTSPAGSAIVKIEPVDGVLE